MRERKNGQFIYVSSISGQAHEASRAAITELTIVPTAI